MRPTPSVPLIPGPAFLGVYFLEVGALTCFLYHMSKIIRLYLRPAAAYGILPVLCALLLSAESFCQGDSAEELCAALLAVTLYHTLAYFREYQGRPMPYGILLIDGVLAGCILWVKYTLLGFHLAYMAMLFFLCVKDRKLLRGIKSCFVFLGGMEVPTVPVLLYFAGNHALGNLFQVYFYNNIFLYDSEKSAGIASLLLTILLRTGDTFLRNIQFSVFTILGVARFSPVPPLPVRQRKNRAGRRSHPAGLLRLHGKQFPLLRIYFQHLPGAGLRRSGKRHRFPSGKTAPKGPAAPDHGRPFSENAAGGAAGDHLSRICLL